MVAPPVFLTGRLAPICKRGHTTPRAKGASCRECIKDWRKENPGKEREYRLRAYAKNRANPEAVARRQRNNRRYNWRAQGINENEAEQRLAAFGGTCECCGSPQPGLRGWCVDHDHTNGAVRGILCTGCNVGIGALGDTEAGVQLALEYLRKCR